MARSRRAASIAAEATAAQDRSKATDIGMWLYRSCRTCRSTSGTGGIPVSVWMIWPGMWIIKARRSVAASMRGILMLAGPLAMPRVPAGFGIHAAAPGTSLGGIPRLVVPQAGLRGILRLSRQMRRGEHEQLHSESNVSISAFSPLSWSSSRQPRTCRDMCGGEYHV